MIELDKSPVLDPDIWIEGDPPSGDLIDLWIEGLDEDGWIVTGRVTHFEPMRVDCEDGCPYWPHENGGYPTHWRPTQRIEAGTGETPQEVRPEGREPDPEGGAPE